MGVITVLLLVDWLWENYCHNNGTILINCSHAVKLPGFLALIVLCNACFCFKLVIYS